MRKYEKPVIEVVELRPEERLATGYIRTASDENANWFYTILDTTATGNVDVFTYGQKSAPTLTTSITNWTDSMIQNLLNALGFGSINWKKP